MTKAPFLQRSGLLLALPLCLLLLGGCEQGAESPPVATATATGPQPPTPPIFETFEGAPQLELFPRIGDYRPAEEESERLAFWRTYMLHFTKTSGIVAIPAPKAHAGKVFSMRSVAGIEALGYFAPLAVEPETSYRLSCALNAALPEGARAGIGILEFDEFLWVAEQFPQALAKKHQLGAQPGLSLTGRLDWQEQRTTFTTGPKTRMIHLVLFRDGTPDRQPVLFDDIRLEKVAP